MNLFTKLFGRRKKKHHVPKTQSVVCDDSISPECECIIDEREQLTEPEAAGVDED